MTDGTKLGAGRICVVYKALDTRLDRVVALKFLPDTMEQDPKALESYRLSPRRIGHPGLSGTRELRKHSIFIVRFALCEVDGSRPGRSRQ